MMPGTAAPPEEVKIAVPQRFKDFVVQRQYRLFWYILVGAFGGINAVSYLVCLACQSKWTPHFQADIIMLLIAMVGYAVEVRRPWHYLINDRRIKLFIVHQKLQPTRMQELEWAKTEVAGVEPGEWQGLPCYRLKVLPAAGYVYTLVYDYADEEEVRTKVLPLIEKYRHQYRQELWADRLRS